MVFYDLFQKLVLAGQIKFTPGHIELLNQPMVISPAWTFAYMLKSSKKPSEIGKLIYEGTKLATQQGMAKKVKEEKKLGGLNLTKWIMDSGSLAGWGKLSLEKFDIKSQTATLYSRNTTVAELYGKSLFPVDHAIRGFSAGTACLVFDRDDIEVIETKCIAMGDKICEFKFMPREQLDKNSSLVKSQVNL